MTPTPPRSQHTRTATAVLALALLASIGARAEGPLASDADVEAWAADHPGTRRFDVVDARREHGSYFGVGVGFAVPLVGDVLPLAPTESAPYVGFGANLSAGGSCGLLGVGVRTSVLYVQLTNLIGFDEDGMFVAVGVEAELDFALVRSRTLAAHVTPHAGIATLITDVPLVPEDGTQPSPTRLVPKSGLDLGVTWNHVRLDLGVGATFPTSAGGTRALAGVLPTFDLRIAYFLQRSRVSQ